MGAEEPAAARRRADSAPRTAPTSKGAERVGRGGGGGGGLDGLEDSMAAVALDGGRAGAEAGEGARADGDVGGGGSGEDGPEMVRDFLKRQGLEQYGQLLLDEG